MDGSKSHKVTSEITSWLEYSYDVYLQCVDSHTSAAFKLGLRLYGEMLRIGFDPDVFTYTALIRGHCVGGNMKEAEEHFTKIQKSDLPIDHVPYRILFKEYC
ncbi:hypothetical protein COP2_039622 [Malus domestica]